MTILLPVRPPRLGWRELLAVAAPLAVGAVGGLVTANAIPTWYRGLAKPAWNPPDAVFGPVWTILYLGMGIALALVWHGARETRARGRRRATRWFVLQLVLNLAWTLTFFGLREIGLAVAVVAGLWLAIAGTLIAFARVRPVAAAMLVPYLAWVTFASVLNVAVWRLNPG